MVFGRTRCLAVLVLAGVIAGTCPRAGVALETDQFTVPPAPLADVGPELAAEVMRRIDTAIARVNARASARSERAASAQGFWQRHHQRERLRALDERSVVLAVYHEIAGPGLPECSIERWARAHRFTRGPARFEIDPARSVYGGSPFGRSPLIVSLSPTINLYGVYCGADKLGHVFQQGHQYFEVFARAESRGGGEDAALAEAVARGVRQESGFYGAALVGVYSNADLAANYAGLKLYLNLTRQVRVGQVIRPPLLVLRDGRWVHNLSAVPHRGDAFLRPIVSDHFNEALNPSRYKGPTRRTVRTRWQARAASWVSFYGTTRRTEAARLQRLATWHGEPYGHSAFHALVTALDTCFGKPTPTPPKSPDVRVSASTR